MLYLVVEKNLTPFSLLREKFDSEFFAMSITIHLKQYFIDKLIFEHLDYFIIVLQILIKY